MEKNYQQSKGSSAISNISMSDDSESNPDDEEQRQQPEATKEGKQVAASKKAAKKQNSMDNMKCIYCWSKKTLTDV